MAAFSQLYEKVIGATGGLFLPQSFHPYQLVNAKGTSVWLAAYAWLVTRPAKEEMLDKISNGSIYPANVPSSFNEYHVWPDNRLLPKQNAAFGTYAPFVIPFIVWKDEKPLSFDVEIQAAIAAGKDAGSYLGGINQAISFLMSPPAFVIGFDEFDEQQPSALIDHFVNFLPALTR